MLLAALLGACSGEEPALPVDFSQREDIAVREDGAQVLTYAYLPQFSHSVSFQRHNRLVRYLRQATGLNIKQVFPDTFDEHMRMVGQGKIDISFANPYIYVKLANDYCSRAFARVVEENGRERFRGEIIVRADNRAVQTLADCRGKRWIAVDPTSAGGFLYPLGLFYEAGLRPRDFAEIAFAPGPGGKQEKVILAVHAGQYDIGSVREGALAVVADKIDLSEIRVLARTPWYPGWVYSARAGLDPAVVDAIRAALIDLNPAQPDERRILENAHITAIIPSQDADYDPVRRLWETVGAAATACADRPQAQGPGDGTPPHAAPQN